MKIGHGYDVHRLVPESELILGGVQIPHHKGLLGHSDADVVLHAICDAILGALGVGDIGQHFPDTDSEYENIDSRILLRKVADLMDKKSFVISNLDVTIAAQAPKLAKYLPQMREFIASDLSVPCEAINLKATTTEGLGFVGEEEGIECYAVVLLDHK